MRSQGLGLWPLVAMLGAASGCSSPSAEHPSQGSGGATSTTGGQGGGGSTAGSAGSAIAGSSSASGGSSGMSTGGSAGSGGSADSAGSSGSGPKPPKVGQCDGLLAAGTWEKISPEGIDWTDSIVVDPFDTSRVWMGVRNHGIYLSTDCGANFELVSTGENAASIGSGSPGSLQVDPIHEGVMYSTAFEGANGLWKSTTSGVDWQPLFPPESEFAQSVEYNLANSVAMEAANPDHLVVSTHASCKAPYGAICEAESTDGGETWKLTTVMPGEGWIPGAGAFILDATTWLFVGYSAGLWLTTDQGESFAEITPSGGSGSTSGKTLIVPFQKSDAGNYFLAAMEGVLHSTNGTTWSVLPNSGGRAVGLAVGGGEVFTADQWTNTYHRASEDDLTTWTVLPPPADLPADQGAPYLAYDATHHLLYSSNWAGGAWRYVTE